jgi:hypothetical protein
MLSVRQAQQEVAEGVLCNYTSFSADQPAQRKNVGQEVDTIIVTLYT